MLHEEVELYTKLSGKNGETTSITVIGAYLDGYEKGKSEQLEPCEDAVSRKAVAGIYTALWEIIGTIMDRDEWDDVCHTTANELPSVTPKQRTGKWIERNDRFDTTCECSICHYKDYIPNAEQYICHDRYWFDRKFCPNCGSRNEVTE